MCSFSGLCSQLLGTLLSPSVSSELLHPKNINRALVWT
jgi:hypothetical protein